MMTQPLLPTVILVKLHRESGWEKLLRLENL